MPNISEKAICAQNGIEKPKVSESNLILGSASARWEMTAPMLVPMLMLVGYAPEVIQAASRIGDSTTPF